MRQKPFEVPFFVDSDANVCSTFERSKVERLQVNI
jgi:hypothetical protein